MAKKILVVIDHAQGRIANPSLETLAMAQKMADTAGASVSALVLGSHVEPVTDRLTGFRLDTVLVVRSERLAEYDPDGYTSALEWVVSREEPWLLVLAHTYQNIDLAPKLAGVLKRPLITDCVDYRWEEGALILVRPMFRNKLYADVEVEGALPWIVTFQVGACSTEELLDGTSSPQVLEPEMDDLPLRRVPGEKIETVDGKVDLSRADIIVGVGRGIKKAENLGLIRELARVLGAEIGASRPVVDNEWMERERQIGSSGQNVSPKLYIACGISGAIQHLVGMKGSSCIVAVNSDPNAPIFNIATYGIVGDLFEVVPALTKELKRLKEKESS